MTANSTSLNSTTAIDQPAGKLVLLIEENRPWQQVELMHKELSLKVRSCVRYVRSQQFTDDHGLSPADTVVRLMCAEQPGAATLQLFERIRYELAKHGIAFEYTLSDQTDSRVSKPESPTIAGSMRRPPTPQEITIYLPRDLTHFPASAPRNRNGSPRNGSGHSSSGAVELDPALATPSAAVAASSSIVEQFLPAPVARPRTTKKPTPAVVVDQKRGSTGRLLILLWLAVAASTTLWGLEYYLTPMQERAYSQLHDLFKPNGTVGLWYGIVGSLMVLLGTAMYSLRKRLHLLHRAGGLNSWLMFHIFLCTLGPYLVLLHTSFKFGGFVAIAFWSMVAVVASGVLGRYLFLHIPRNIGSRRVLLEQVRAQQRALVEAMAMTGHTKARAIEGILRDCSQQNPKGLRHAFILGIQYDLTGRALKRRVENRLKLIGIPQAVQQRIKVLVVKQIELERQIALLMPFQKLFGYWHVAHLPLSTVMCLTTVLHILIAALFGYAKVF